MKFWKLSIFAAAVLLSVISLALPAAQWAAIPSASWAKWLAGGTAVALGVCKLGFLPLAWHHLANRNLVPGLCLGLFALMFLAINVDATADWLNANSSTRNQLTQTGSDNHQRLTQQLNDLNQTINTVNGLLAADLQNDYRERAYQQQTQLAELRKERNRITAQLNNGQQAAANDRQAGFGISLGQSDGNQYSGTGAAVEGELLTALSIQVGCVLAVLACGAWAAPLTDNRPVKPMASPTKPKPQVRAEDKPATAIKKKGGEPAKLDDLQLALAENIKAGVYGNNPSVKALSEKKVIRGGYNKVNPVFLHLVANGDLKREGKGYQLTQLTIS